MSVNSRDNWPTRKLKATIEELYRIPREELIRFLTTAETPEYVSEADADGLLRGRPIELRGQRFFEIPFSRSKAASDILKLVPVIGKEKVLATLREPTRPRD